MQSFTYFLILLGTVIICFLFSFHPLIRFQRHFRVFLRSATLVAIPFLIWDYWFTNIGVWWFNESYTVNINFFDLPIEEILFFICIPFSCVFTYYVINQWKDLRWAGIMESIVAASLILIFVIVGFLYRDKWYTVLTFASAATSIFIVRFYIGKSILGKALTTYIILLPGFLVVNGLLTGTCLSSPIVNYNPEEMLNIRIATIPIEDSVYGFVLFLWNIVLFEKWSVKENTFTTPPC